MQLNPISITVPSSKNTTCSLYIFTAKTTDLITDGVADVWCELIGSGCTGIDSNLRTKFIVCILLLPEGRAKTASAAKYLVPRLNPVKLTVHSCLLDAAHLLIGDWLLETIHYVCFIMIQHFSHSKLSGCIVSIGRNITICDDKVFVIIYSIAGRINLPRMLFVSLLCLPCENFF